jgi:hypothetical protein
LVNKLKTTGSLLDKKLDRKQNVLTEQKLDDIAARLEPSPRKSLQQVAHETNVSKWSTQMATKLLHLTM